MIWPFKRRKSPVSALSPVEEKYRAERIAEISAATGKSLADAMEFADRWFIQKVYGSTDGGDPVAQYIPFPIWDDEWLLTRNSFPTYSDALAEVLKHGGVLLASVEEEG